MLVYRRVTPLPSIKFAGTHFYTWVERGPARVKWTHRNYPRAPTRIAWSQDERTNHEATAPLPSTRRGWFNEKHKILSPEDTERWHERWHEKPTISLFVCINKAQSYLIPELIGGDLIVLVTRSCSSAVSPAKQNITHHTHQTHVTASSPWLISALFIFQHNCFTILLTQEKREANLKKGK